MSREHWLWRTAVTYLINAAELRHDHGTATGAIFRPPIDSGGDCLPYYEERLKSSTVEEAVGRACLPSRAYSLVVARPEKLVGQGIPCWF